MAVARTKLAYVLRDFMTEVRRQKLQYIGHIVRAQNLRTSILHGRIAGVRGRGRPRRRWMDIKDWTGLSAAECVERTRERQHGVNLCVVVVHGLDLQQ